MNMIIFYYHLTNMATKEKRIFPTCNFLGDIGEVINIANHKYRIDDYAVERSYQIKEEY